MIIGAIRAGYCSFSLNQFPVFHPSASMVVAELEDEVCVTLVDMSSVRVLYATVQSKIPLSAFGGGEIKDYRGLLRR